MEESCASCKFLKPIMCHPCNGENPADALPWEINRLKVGYGPINKQFGWVCTLPLMENFVFFDKDTGLCECYTKNEING